ncbi:MAG: hypothetical protein ABI619_07225, partial [Betaproteobacteria bacterium]
SAVSGRKRTSTPQAEATMVPAGPGLRSSRIRIPSREETDMTDPTQEKSAAEKSRDMISQLKNMSHYSRTNVEKLTEFWLALEGEMKQKKVAKFETLLSHQNSFHDSFDTFVPDFETECSLLEKSKAS